MNILRRLFGPKRHPDELMLLFNRADCVLSNFGVTAAHKFVKIHMNTPNIVHYVCL